MSAHPKFLVVVFDGLRPDMVTPDAAPNLSRFGIEGCNFSASRTVFPTHTRVIATALATGSFPRNHGIVGNMFYDPKVFRDRVINTGDITHIEAGQLAYGGRLVTTTSMGEIAAQNGFRVAVVSTGSGGSTRLANPKARELGHVSLCLRAWEASIPADCAGKLLEGFDPIPPAARPNSARTRMQTDMFLEGVFPQVQPDISVLWYTDPDFTHHYCGIGSAESHRAIRDIDDEFERLLAWRQRSGLHERLHIIVTSDHGHIGARRKVRVREELAKAGLHFDTHFLDGADYAGKLGYSGAIWVRNSDRGLKGALVDWLFEQPWCGLVFTSGGDGIEGGIPGTFDRSLVMTDHERAPEIYYVMRNDDAVDANGVVGGCYFDGKYPEGGSVHGGLHPKELNIILMAQGAQFRHSFQSDYPAGIIDIAPTILHLLGLPRPDGMDGRVLNEGLVGCPLKPQDPEKLEHSVGPGARRQHLQFSRVGSTLYLDGGWVEEATE
jgi:hypothetical protein